MEHCLWGFTQDGQEGQETPLAETATAAVKNAFLLRYDKGYSLIALNMEKGLQVHISLVTNPLEAWKYSKSSSSLYRSNRLSASIVNLTQLP